MFEIWTGERGTAEARIYKIYADGRVEGFGDAPILINRLPKFIDRVVSEINKAQGAIVARVRREMGI